MQTDIITIYQNILTSQGIHSFFLRPPYTYIKDADYGFREHLFRNYNYEQILSLLSKITPEQPVLIYQDDFMVEYCLFLFPEELQEQYQATHFLIGPTLFQAPEDEQINIFMERHKLPPQCYREFVEFYNRIPLLPNRDFWISLLNPLFHSIYGDEVRHQYHEFNTSFIESYEVQESGFSFEAIEARYEVERKLLSAVAIGDLDKAIEYQNRFRQFRFSMRTTDSLRHKKNLLLTLNTLLRKSIEDSHVHPFYIDRVSSDFSVRIEKAINEAQLESIPLQMIRKYCLLVKNHSTQNYSALVEKCVHQIHFHYTEPLSLEILAKANAVSTSYLSSLFHKETGKTITHYINETRVQHSIRLLNTTTLSVSEIASLCGFSDANYYTRTFKKINGMTPMAYRKSITQP